jgi:citrate lyase gamma subunit
VTEEQVQVKPGSVDNIALSLLSSDAKGFRQHVQAVFENVAAVRKREQQDLQMEVRC